LIFLYFKIKGQIMELDLTKVQLAFAKTNTTCDYCSETLGSTYPSAMGCITARLRKHPNTVGGYDWQEKEDHHYCGEACMREHLNERAQADTKWRGNPKQMGDKDINKPDALESKASEETNEELTAEGKITTKERDKMKSSTFLYPETRSYPIRNCQDIKNAIHAFGRGGNKDSYGEFLAKLHRKAKSLGLEGCIPESTRKEHNLE
jgi:hypothetical protein